MKNGINTGQFRMKMKSRGNGRNKSSCKCGNGQNKIENITGQNGMFFRPYSTLKRIIVIFIRQEKGKQKDYKKHHNQMAPTVLPMNKTNKVKQPMPQPETHKKRETTTTL
jgi:predicted ATPase